MCPSAPWLATAMDDWFEAAHPSNPSLLLLLMIDAVYLSAFLHSWA